MQAKQTKRAGLYTRVSKADLSQNPDNQLLKLRKYASERDLSVDERFTYVDFASGGNPNRIALKRMLNDAKGHRFSVVLATKYDRIARSVIDLETIIRELDRSGIELRCIDEPVDTTTPEGVAFRQMLAVMAQLERGLIRDRTKAGLAGARARGKRLGRPRCPIDLERVHELREQGLGLRRIARQMDVSHQTIRNRLRKEGRRSPIENESTEGGQTNGR